MSVHAAGRARTWSTGNSSSSIINNNNNLNGDATTIGPRQDRKRSLVKDNQYHHLPPPPFASVAPRRVSSASSAAPAASLTSIEKTTTTSSSTTTTLTAAATHTPRNDDDGNGVHNAAGACNEDEVAAPTFLQPRVAALLNLSRHWHPVLFCLRLLSIAPAIVLGFPLALRFLLMLYYAFLNNAAASKAGGLGSSVTAAEELFTSTFDGEALGEGRRSVEENRLLLTETMLATLWCGCSGYLSFYFTDCLMSRWLINYTPSATAFRLVAISALNGYLQSWTLHLSGSAQDPFLLLPTWITITSTLTLVYHITYREINIRKETSTSISVFSMASYLSMVALLVQQHWDRNDWLELPFVALGYGILRGGGEVVVKVAKYANITVEP